MTMMMMIDGVGGVRTSGWHAVNRTKCWIGRGWFAFRGTHNAVAFSLAALIDSDSKSDKNSRDDDDTDDDRWSNMQL